MNVVIFTGPSLTADEAKGQLDAVYLPPVSQGDVYRVALKKPQVIGIIDGYFERMPAVWHKEILWAMKQGIHVYGSASMGALRAMELAPFGMIGIGKIFEAYRDGLLEDDDEVAIIHGPASIGFAATSEAMVNIRYTLESANSNGLIDRSTMDELVRIAKDLYYPLRRYQTILDLASEEGLPENQLSTLRNWLPIGKINRKKEDALAMLRAIREALDAGMRPKKAKYFFEHTDMWDHVSRYAGEIRFGPLVDPDILFSDDFFDEVRLEANLDHNVLQAVILRFLALEMARRQGINLSQETINETTARFCREQLLNGPEDLKNWIEDNELNFQEFNHLMEEEAQISWIKMMAKPEVVNHLPNYLRSNSRYTRLKLRAFEKQRFLQDNGLLTITVAESKMTEDDLIYWYFNDLRGTSIPKNLEEYTLTIGFDDRSDFLQAVLKEHYFVMYSKRVSPKATAE